MAWGGWEEKKSEGLTREQVVPEARNKRVKEKAGVMTRRIPLEWEI